MGGEGQLRDDFRQLREGAMQGHRPGGGKRDFNAEFRIAFARACGYRITERCCQRGSGRSYFNEPLCPGTVVALSVIVKARERNPASSAELRLSLIAPFVIREDRAPLVERFPLVHTEPSRNTAPGARWSRSDAY